MKPSQIVDYSQYPRSALKSEAPINFGEATVESVDSYVERLTSTHDVQRKDIECYVTGDNEPRRRSAGHVEPLRPDSPYASSEKFATALAALTHQPTVARLGLGWMHTMLGRSDALKPYSAWCSICLRQAHYGRAPHSKPLSWSIRGVEACVIHGVKLSTTCSNCGLSLNVRSGLKYPFELCPHCAVPLFKIDEIEQRIAILASEEQMIVARQVGEMLASLPMLPLQALHAPNLRDVIDSCNRRGIGGTNQLIRNADISKGHLSALLKGAKAGLDTWVRVAVGADLSLAGLFSDGLWKEDVSGVCIAWKPTMLPRVRRPPIDWSATVQIAEAQIASGSSKGFYAFCREMGIDQRHAGKMLGNLQGALNLVAGGNKAQRKLERVQALARKMKSAAEEFHRAGVRVSARSMARHLEFSRQATDFVLAYGSFAAEVGAKPYIGKRRKSRAKPRPPEQTSDLLNG